ncbi:MAG: PAQR family membrane homeostasis protein TrhA [Bradymonadaceae bacterium]
MSSETSINVEETDHVAELSELGKEVGRRAAEAARAITIDELANSVSHGIGLGLSLAGLTILAVLTGLHGDPLLITSSLIYGITLVILYTASTLYHSFHPPRLKHAFRIFDHAAIFFLIAGTYTPFTLVALEGPVGWWLFGFAWTVAIVGATIKIFFFGRFPRATLGLYLGMGWALVFAIKPLLAALPTGGIALIGLGGFFYTGGVIFYLWERLYLNHTIWHLFVMGGSISHFLAILFYVVWPAVAV